MSRYTLEPHSQRYEVSIGWDRPLANFFLQVVDRDVDEDKADPILVWLGADGYATETDVDHVLEEASTWAMIPQEFRTRLLSDQRCEGVRPAMTIR
jgi:hypothetical protein